MVFPPQILTPQQAQALQSAFQLLQQGDTNAALRKVDGVLAHVPDLVDGLHLKALILKAQYDHAAAETILRRAHTLSPTHAHVLNSLGSLLGDMGRHADALAVLKHALEAAPDNLDAWINTGIIANEARLTAMSLKALEYVVAAAPQNAQGWAALGTTLKDARRFEDASVALKKALALDPRNTRARYTLGVALRLMDEPELALAAFERAISDGLSGPAAATGRAHVLAELGRYDAAIASYRAVIAQHPEHVDALEALSRTLPQVDATADALQDFAQALDTSPRSRGLWLSALSTASDLKDYQRQLDWSDAAAQALGPDVAFDLARSGALMMLGDEAEAESLLASILNAHPDNGAAHNFMAHIQLKKRDADKAAYHATRVSEVDPANQSAWAYLATAWRLAGDPREAWLTNYEAHVADIDLGLSTSALAELRAALLGLHNTEHHPTEQSLRNGTQTRGELFLKKLPAIRQLQQTLSEAIQRHIAALPDDPAHPFLRRKPQAVAFSGSWSVKLRSAGFHISHIHPMGWMSSAFYVDLPPEVGTGSEAGALAFGVPDATLALDLPPRRIIHPAPGRLALFPSYMWHGTIPFESASERLTVAFDVAGL